MMRGLVNLFVLIVVGFAGWIAGSLYPAPAEVTAYVSPAAREKAQRLADNVIQSAQASGVVIEHAMDQATKDAETASSPPPSPSSTVANAPAVAAISSALATPQKGFEAQMSLCPRMTVSDAPATDAQRHIVNFSSLVTVNGNVLAVDPIRDACLSSGFGVRDGKLHKGIDFYNPNGGPILAAGDGMIREMKYRDDYGNMLLIDHGRGVYTRYAHLSSFQPGLAVGAHVHAGDQIGLMGNTAAYPVPLHLHYELLLGDYSNPKGSFGLVPHNPFEYRTAG